MVREWEGQVGEAGREGRLCTESGDGERGGRLAGAVDAHCVEAICAVNTGGERCEHVLGCVGERVMSEAGGNLSASRQSLSLKSLALSLVPSQLTLLYPAI